MPVKGEIGRHAEFHRPKWAWLPSIAASGLTVSNGFHASWDGDLLASSLRGQVIARIRIVDDEVIFVEHLNVGKRIRYILQHPDGAIVLWTDDYKVLFLVPAEGGMGFKYVEYNLSNADIPSSIQQKSISAIQNCMECHSLDEHDSVRAPSLAKVFGAKLGSTDYQHYSDSLRNDERIWTRELLSDFLVAPETVIPGTTMPSSNLNDPLVVDAIVSALDGLKNDVSIPPAERER